MIKRERKKKQNAVLLRHRQYLNNLEAKKNQELLEKRVEIIENIKRESRLKEQAEKQRSRMREHKDAESLEMDEIKPEVKQEVPIKPKVLQVVPLQEEVLPIISIEN